jgi:hypothetical protein
LETVATTTTVPDDVENLDVEIVEQFDRLAGAVIDALTALIAVDFNSPLR